MANYSQTQAKVICALIGHHSYNRVGDLLVCKLCGNSKPYEKKQSWFGSSGIVFTASHPDYDNKEVHDRAMGYFDMSEADEESDEDDE